MSGYDLHTHTVLSDGTTTPEQNVRDAAELGLEGLAVTDHDTTDGIDRARSAAVGSTLDVVGGTELSAEVEGASVHVLGYWVDPGHGPLQDEMQRLRGERDRRAETTVARLAELGIEVSIARVREIADGAPVGRPHIARAVVETGAAGDTQEVFDTWLHDGGPAYVPKYAVDPVRAVEMIVTAGGVAVVAHPGLYGRDDGGLAPSVIEAMAGAGMAGIEADHPDHDAPTRTRYRDVAAALDLVVTAGSDYHGAGKDNRLGEATTPRARVERLRERRM